MTATTTTTTAAAGPHFLEDDFAGAVAAASTSGKVVFVDAWAPWCHTCLSMQQLVLSRPELAAYADRVVFVAIDTDRPNNSAFLERFTVKLWPTFFVVSGDGQRTLGVHPGSMDLEETKRFLDDGIRLARGDAGAANGPEKSLLEAHAAFARNELPAAIAGYGAAASTSWPRRTEAVLGGMRALSAAKDWGGCVRFGTAHLRDVDGGGAPGDLAAALLSCAERSDDAVVVAATRPLVRDRLLELVKAPAASSSVDDRADVLATLADVQEALGDKAAATTTHTTRLALLEAEAAKATTPKQAQVHDYARLNSLLALGRGDDAVALFRERVKALPDDYEPWARLASALYRLDRADEAVAAVDEAIRLSYGLRKLRYRTLAADIANKRHDRAGERAQLQALVQEATALPTVLRDETLLKTAQDRLAALPTTAAPAAAP